MAQPTEAQSTTGIKTSLHLPDAASAVENGLLRALDYCAQKMNLTSPEMALEYLRHGDAAARSYCQFSIARQVAEALGALDENVKSVWLFEYDATQDDLSLGARSQAVPIHLLAWTSRKTSALQSVVAALDRALTQQYSRLVGPRGLTQVLDVQLVDDADVESRRGYGSLLRSLHNRPLLIWER
jgi:hypothetical protein